MSPSPTPPATSFLPSFPHTMPAVTLPRALSNTSLLLVLFICLLLPNLLSLARALHTPNLEYDLRTLILDGDPRRNDTKLPTRTKRVAYKQSQAAATLNFTWPDRKVVAMEGQVILGGLMMVHERHSDVVCGPSCLRGGVQALEAMLYTLDFINDQEDFIPGVRLGAHILDDCDKDTYGLEQAVDFIKGSISNIDDGEYQCRDGSSPEVRNKVISGVVGAAASVTSIQVANLRLFKIPQYANNVGNTTT